MAGENAFVNNFLQNCTVVTTATAHGFIVQRGVIAYPNNHHYQYVDTGEGAREPNELLYTDSISWCSGLALWSQGRAGLLHVIPGTGAAEVEDFLDFHDNGAVGLPTRIVVATQPGYAPPYGSDQEAVSRSPYAVLRALHNHYGGGVSAVTTVISGYGGRAWSSQARLSVSARNGISLAIP